MLNELSIKEKYKVISRELYAVVEETGEKRKVNEEGCEVLKQTVADIKQTEQWIAELVDKVNQLEKENEARHKLRGELLSCGFCEKNYKKQDRDMTTGIVIDEYDWHKFNCRNRNQKREVNNGVV